MLLAACAALSCSFLLQPLQAQEPAGQDWNLPAPPALFDVTVNGETIPVLAKIGKPGLRMFTPAYPDLETVRARFAASDFARPAFADMGDGTRAEVVALVGRNWPNTWL